MTEVSGKKEKISIIDYGDMVSDCTGSAGLTAVGSFFLGSVSFPVFLKYLDRFLLTSYEVKIASSIFGALALSLYSAKKARVNCEKKVARDYEPIAHN